jgi:organic hydroperoxide reductase OsmC/OhrA
MEEYFYEVDLSWKSEKTGTLNSHGLSKIEVSSPIEGPGQTKNNWTPEHLLAGSVSSCFMNTFLDIAAHAKLEILNYRCQCFVKLQKVKDKYIASEILVRPIIQLTNDLEILKAYKCIEEAEAVCPIKNALKIIVEVHPQFKYLHKGVKVKV